MQRTMAPKRKHVFLLAILLTSLSACSPSQPRGEPISLPFTVGSVPPLEFVIQQNDDTFQFRVLCQGTGQWQRIALDVRTMASTNTSSTTATAARTCGSDNASIFSGSLFRVDELKQGEKVDIYFDVVLGQGQATKTGRTFVVGEGGKLYRADAP